jgi:hypothetical protein
MRGFLRSMLTTADNQTADIGRVLLLLFGVALVILAFVDVLRGHPFDAISFGAASGALLGGGGAGLALKLKSEPGILPDRGER